MTEDKLWDIFAGTGSVFDYLRYSAEKEKNNADN